MKRLLRPFIFVIALIAFGTTTVGAHAQLIRSVPKAGAVLDESPSEIILEFTENLDPSFSKLELLDANGEILNQGPGVIDPTAPHVLRLKQPPLPNGVYSAIWRVRSDIDGHITEGNIGFSIGESNLLVSLLPPPGTTNPATALPNFIDTIARWLSYLTLAVFLGSVLFAVLVWRPSYTELKNVAADKAITYQLKSFALIGLVGLCLATLFFLIVQVIQASSIDSSLGKWGSFLQLMNGRMGHILMFRILLSMVSIYLVRRLPDVSTELSWPWWVVLAIGGGIILTFGLQSHGAARESILPIIVNWFHLAAMTAWLGGLPPLFWILRKENTSAVVVVPQFSMMALFSVAILGISGAVNWWEYVQSWEAAISTTYGHAILLKTIIFGLLFALGTLNLYVFSPGLYDAGSNAIKSLLASVRLEIILGILLLIFVGIVTGVSPAHDALEAKFEQGVIETVKINGVEMTLRAAPGTIGDNEFRVEINDPRTHADQVLGEVLLRFTSQGMDMGTEQVETTTTDGKNFSARGSFFSMNGGWEVEVILRREGFDDIRHSFDLSVH